MEEEEENFTGSFLFAIFTFLQFATLLASLAQSLSLVTIFIYTRLNLRGGGGGGGGGGGKSTDHFHLGVSPV